MNSEQAHIPGLSKSTQNLGWRVVLVLAALIALAEEVIWVPSSLIRKLTIVQFQGIECPLLTSMDIRHTHVVHITHADIHTFI